jgi:hypothetical protein
VTYQSFIALFKRSIDPLTITYSLHPLLGEIGDHELLNVPKIKILAMEVSLGSNLLNYILS